MGLREVLVQALREQIGEERFRKFVDASNYNRWRGKGLAYWQTQVWKDLIAKYPEADLPVEAVQSLFGICSLHLCPLERPANPEATPPFRETDEYHEAAKNLFPYHGTLIGVTAIFEGCPRCCKAKKRWLAEKALSVRSLVQQTTFAEYRSHLPEILPEAFDQQLHDIENQIVHATSPGHELWEFDCGGWELGEGMGGLAIVRDGTIVKWWVIELGDRDWQSDSE